MIIDIFLIISLILIAWLGWQTGFIRSCFAVIAGFCAILAAWKYPYQEGFNFYYIFIIVALFVIIVGGIVSRIIKFFYLNTIDRLGGLIVNILVWLIVSVNVIIPTMISGTHGLEEQKYVVYTYVSTIMKSKVHMFEDYVPSFLAKKFIKHEKH
ncbi:MAG: CvpA family protein [Endomicrobium sp.]|nr:CvpA family protein [Endomicrobium sp.]